MKQKTFYRALIEASISPETSKKYLNDKRLTSAEKKIFESYFLIRNNKNTEAYEALSTLSCIDFPFVEAQKQSLLGLSLLNQSYFLQAETFIKKAIPVFHDIGAHYFEFMACFNLCMVYLGLNQTEKMLETIKIMEGIHQEHDIQHLRLLRTKFNYFAEINDVENASMILSQLAPLKKQMPESDIISHLVCEFMFYVNLEHFEQCQNVLTEMKSYRKFHLTENYNFMKLMLNHLTHNSPIYLSGDEFSSVPILYHQLKVIHAFEDNDQELAMKHWLELSSILPDIYQENFYYNGIKCLFSLCLNKHLKPRSIPLKLEKDPEHSYFDSLWNLLASSPAPLSKGYIYEYIWGEPPVEKEDLKKLSRLISRIRAEKGVEVCSRKGTYFIEKNVPKRKVG